CPVAAATTGAPHGAEMSSPLWPRGEAQPTSPKKVVIGPEAGQVSATRVVGGRAGNAGESDADVDERDSMLEASWRTSRTGVTSLDSATIDVWLAGAGARTAIGRAPGSTSSCPGTINSDVSSSLARRISCTSRW